MGGQTHPPPLRCCQAAVRVVDDPDACHWSFHRNYFWQSQLVTSVPIRCVRRLHAQRSRQTSGRNGKSIDRLFLTPGHIRIPNGAIQFAPTGKFSCILFFSQPRSAQQCLLRSQQTISPLVSSRCGRQALFFVTVTRMCLSAPLQRTRLWTYTSGSVGWVALVPTSSPGPSFFPLAPFWLHRCYPRLQGACGLGSSAILHARARAQLPPHLFLRSSWP